MDSIKAEWNVLIDSCALLTMAGRSNMTSSSGFAFLIPPLIVTETDLQQSLCTCTCLSSGGSLLYHGKGAHMASIWSVAQSDLFKASESLFEPLLFCYAGVCVCVCCMCVFTEIMITNTFHPAEAGTQRRCSRCCLHHFMRSEAPLRCCFQVSLCQ